MVNWIFISVAFLLLLSVAEGSDTLKEVHASEILEQIEKGEPVKYDHVIIVGDLDLSRLELDRGSDGLDAPDLKGKKLVKSPIQIRNSEIQGQVNFSESIFLESIDFANTKFHGGVFFFDAVFEGYANFRDTYFDEEAYFGGAIFNERAYFYGAQFNRYTNFMESKFDKRADFKYSRFQDFIEFQEAVFEEDARFWGAKFAKDAKFMNVEFDQDAEFWGARFGGDANFAGSNFARYAYFNDNPSSRLTSAKFNKSLILDSAAIYKMWLDKVDFDEKSRISLNNSDFNQLIVRWDAIKDHLNCDGAAYLALIENFKNLEYFGDADDCYYQYRQNSQSRKSWWDRSKYFDIFSWASCGYGVRYYHTILSGLGVILFFGLYLSSKSEGAGFDKVELKQKFTESLSFSAIVLISAPSDWYPFGKEKYAELIKRYIYLAIFERLIGYGLLVLLIGVLSRLMIRY